MSRPSSKCPDVVKQIEDYVTIKYDDTNLPDVSLLMNMFNKLNNTYSSSKDNYVKRMHLNIIKHFKVMTNHKNKLALREYLEATNNRYNFDKADFR